MGLTCQVHLFPVPPISTCRYKFTSSFCRLSSFARTDSERLSHSGRGIGVWLFERATNVDSEKWVVILTNMEEGTSRTMIDEDQVIVNAV